MLPAAEHASKLALHLPLSRLAAKLQQVTLYRSFRYRDVRWVAPLCDYSLESVQMLDDMQAFLPRQQNGNSNNILYLKMMPEKVRTRWWRSVSIKKQTNKKTLFYRN